MLEFGVNWRYWMFGIGTCKGIKMFWISIGPAYMEVWYKEEEYKKIKKA